MLPAGIMGGLAGRRPAVGEQVPVTRLRGMQGSVTAPGPLCLRPLRLQCPPAPLPTCMSQQVWVHVLPLHLTPAVFAPPPPPTPNTPGGARVAEGQKHEE